MRAMGMNPTESELLELINEVTVQWDIEEGRYIIHSKMGRIS